jgi:hypothetical protein
LVLAIACCLLLGSCGLPGSGSTDPTPEPSSTPAQTPIPTTAITTPLSVAPPVWTTGIDPTDGSPIDQVEWFPTDATIIYAAFQTSEIASGTGFSVSWSMNGTAVPGLNPTLQMNTDTPAGWIEFHLTRTTPEPWPAGTLEIHISVGGTIVSSGSIDLRDP